MSRLLDAGFELTLRPLRYPAFYEMYRSAIRNTWTVEEVEFGWGPIGWIHDLALQRWWQASVAKEVSEIARLMREGERGKGLAAL